MVVVDGIRKRREIARRVDQKSGCVPYLTPFSDWPPPTPSSELQPEAVTSGSQSARRAVKSSAPAVFKFSHSVLVCTTSSTAIDSLQLPHSSEKLGAWFPTDLLSGFTNCQPVHQLEKASQSLKLQVGVVAEMGRTKEDATIGIIGMGDMGKMYAQRLSDAGWR